MKRFFIMLLIACSAITTVSADSLTAPQKKKPENVIAALNVIIDKFGVNEGQVYSVNRNPNTGIIESSTKIFSFECPVSAIQNDNVLKAVAINFQKDEPLAYQFLHIQPGSTEYFQLKIITNNGYDIKTLHIRNNSYAEMWLMCCKNPENPQLRDAYAITYDTFQKSVKGTVYMITSLRPDLYEKNMSSASLLSDNKNTFTIDGRVGYDLTDSLYVVYMADTAEELNNVRDSDFVAYMPVVNKRFSFSVELDKRKVGRIRTVMPDGSLCHLWTNLDFVPGETYRITTHNGYYDEDRDYEHRVGRYSGHSLLNEPQRRGIDDQAVEIIDSIPEEFRSVETNPRQDWRNSLTAQQQAQIELKSEVVGLEIEKIMANYQLIADEMEGLRDQYKIGTIYEKILKQNKELDKKFQDVIKFAKECHCPASEMPTLYKDILQFYTEQNKGVSELFKNFGYSREAKPARKLQKYLNEQMEKYIKEMEKSLQ